MCSFFSFFVLKEAWDCLLEVRVIQDRFNTSSILQVSIHCVMPNFISIHISYPDMCSFDILGPIYFIFSAV
jgi:hypothetical protein